MSLRAVIDMLLHRTFGLPLPALLGSALLLLLLLLNLQIFRHHSKYMDAQRKSSHLVQSCTAPAVYKASPLLIGRRIAVVGGAHAYAHVWL